MDKSDCVIAVAVIDDDQRVLESLENLLESAGYTVRLFTSAQAFLKDEAFAKVDCVISDIGMPAIDGSNWNDSRGPRVRTYPLS